MALVYEASIPSQDEARDGEVKVTLGNDVGKNAYGACLGIEGDGFKILVGLSPEELVALNVSPPV